MWGFSPLQSGPLFSRKNKFFLFYFFVLWNNVFLICAHGSSSIMKCRSNEVSTRMSKDERGCARAQTRSFCYQASFLGIITSGAYLFSNQNSVNVDISKLMTETCTKYFENGKGRTSQNWGWEKKITIFIIFKLIILFLTVSQKLFLSFY